jgi:catechol 2,3-dioxygenase-like lactoylglutathione lyase family enzyme
MGSTQTHGEQSTTDGNVEMKLEVEILPVSDVDRAKRFYAGLGWRVDADYTPPGEDFRVVQLTPPGSECSIIFGRGVTTAAAGSVQGLMLIVSDIEAAREELLRHGADVSEVFHDERGVFARAGGKGRAPGPDPDGRSYRSWVSFSDLDGNGWLLQEVKTRLPGRGGLVTDVATLTDVLREAEQHHGEYEPTAPKHHWSTFYAAYIAAREHGKDGDEAARDAALHVESVGKVGPEVKA